ncbi:hypothetical protein ACI1VO_05985, partial [Escherichia coli]
MMNTEGNNGNKPLGLWNVVSIGIGAASYTHSTATGTVSYLVCR